MFVLSFFLQVYICLVTYEYFMTSIADADGRCIYLIAVSKHYSVKIATYKYRHRVRGTT